MHPGQITAEHVDRVLQLSGLFRRRDRLACDPIRPHAREPTLTFLAYIGAFLLVAIGIYLLFAAVVVFMVCKAFPDTRSRR